MGRNWAPNTKDVFEYDQVHKMVIVGDAGVGKSSLVARFTDNTHSEAHVPTIGVDFKLRRLTLSDGRVIKLHLWDTTGNERFKSITRAYYRAAHGIAICFDTSSESSFEHVAGWLEAVQQFGSSGVATMLIGTKSDLEAQRQVTRERAEQLAASKGLAYIETSALRDENVQLVFESMAREMARRQAEMASQRRDIIRAGEAPLSYAIANWRPSVAMAMGDGGCCSCLPFLVNMLVERQPPSSPRWSPVGGAPALVSVPSSVAVGSCA